MKCVHHGEQCSWSHLSRPYAQGDKSGYRQQRNSESRDCRRCCPAPRTGRAQQTRAQVPWLRAGSRASPGTAGPGFVAVLIPQHGDQHHPLCSAKIRFPGIPILVPFCHRTHPRAAAQYLLNGSFHSEAGKDILGTIDLPQLHLS